MRVYDKTHHIFRNIEVPILANETHTKLIISQQIYQNIPIPYIHITIDFSKQIIYSLNIFQEIYQIDISDKKDIKPKLSYVSKTYGLDYNLYVLPVLLLKYKYNLEIQNQCKKENLFIPLVLKSIANLLFKSSQPNISKLKILQNNIMYKKYNVSIEAMIRFKWNIKSDEYPFYNSQFKIPKYITSFGTYTCIRNNTLLSYNIESQIKKIEYSTIDLFQYFKYMKTSTQLFFIQYKDQYKLNTDITITREMITNLKSLSENIILIKIIDQNNLIVDIHIKESFLIYKDKSTKTDYVSILNQHNINIQLDIKKTQETLLSGYMILPISNSFRLYFLKDLILNTNICSILYNICDDIHKFDNLKKERLDTLRCIFQHPLDNQLKLKLTMKHYKCGLKVFFENIPILNILSYIMFSLQNIILLYDKNIKEIEKSYRNYKLKIEYRLTCKPKKINEYEDIKTISRPNNLGYEKKIPILLNDISYLLLKFPIQLFTLNTISNKDSFLWCVQQSIKIKSSLSISSIKNMFINDKRYLSMCKQECYGLSTQEIKKKMKNDFSPYYFKQITEHYFNVGIIIIGQHQLFKSRYRYQYFCNDFDHYILIFQQQQNQNIRYFQIRSKQSKQTLFSKRQVYNLLQLYSYRIIHNLILPLSYIQYQYIDKNGKTRCLYIYDKNHNLIKIHTQPIQPLYCLEIPDDMKYKTPTLSLENIHFIYSLFGHTSPLISSKCTFSWRSFNIQMNIKDKEKESVSYLSQYRHNKSIAEFLRNSILYLYKKLNISLSLFINNTKLFIIQKNITIDLICLYLSKNIICVPSLSIKEKLIYYLKYVITRKISYDHLNDSWFNITKWKYEQMSLNHMKYDNNEILFHNSYDIISYLLCNL